MKLIESWSRHVRLQLQIPKSAEVVLDLDHNNTSSADCVSTKKVLLLIQLPYNGFQPTAPKLIYCKKEKKNTKTRCALVVVGYCQIDITW